MRIKTRGFVMKKQRTNNKMRNITRNKWTKAMRIKTRGFVMKKQMKKLVNLEKTLSDGNQKPFFKILSSWMSSAGQEFPEKLVVNGKLYAGPNVMEGLEIVTKEQSTKEMQFVEKIDPMFIRMKKFNHCYSKLIKHDGIEVRYVPDNEIMEKVASMKSGKAPDLFNMNRECIMNLSPLCQARFCSLIRDMLCDPKKYSSTLASI